MTYPSTVTPKAQPLNAQHPHGPLDPWSRRLLPLCDGKLTIAEIAARLLLPIQVVQKLVEKATQRGWIHVPGQQTSCFTALSGELNIMFGARTTELLGDAMHMIRITPNHLDTRQVTDVLIAVELLLPREQAELYGAQLDQIRDTYAT